MDAERGKEKKNFILKKLLIVLFWLIVWQAVSLLVGNAILLEGPIAVIKRLLSDLGTIEYYRTVGESLLRIVGGFLCGTVLAVVLGILAWKNKLFEQVLLPMVQFLKAAPIACFVVLLLIWAGSGNLAFYISLFVAFPPVYFNLLEGLKQIGEKQMEVARVYHMPFFHRMRFIYLPGVESYIISALSLAIGTAFKAGVAAEIIGTPDYSMGEKIYMSKIYLDTAGVLSWMITVIFVAYVCEKLFVKLAVYYFHKRPKIRVNSKNSARYLMKNIQSEAVWLKNCRISYGKELIFENISAAFETGKNYAITGMSGIGKTTLFSVISGLKKAEAGEIYGTENVRAYVFQENRLFEECTALENVYATGQCSMDIETVKAALSELLPEESYGKPVKEYSGGMKRRVEIARAILSDSPVLLMDEPFNGLDEQTKEKTIVFLKKYKQGRTILFTSHCRADIEKMQAEEFCL